MANLEAARIEPEGRETASGNCRSCGLRRQQLGGLCRACGRTAGLYAVPGPLRPRAQATEALRRAVIEAPTVLYSVTIGHVDYDVVWDGSIR